MILLMDTDIGDDIDDALALGFLMKTDIEIAGITTVYREAAKRAHIVRRLLELEGRNDIPVFAGASKPLSEGARTLGVLNYGEESAEEEDDGGLAAVKFIAECAEKYGNELVLLAIGAQTNVAMAIMRYPEKMQKAGRIVVMGGCFTLAHDEWNIACDPTAARIVLESGLNVEYVPWEITSRVCIGKKNYDYILGLECGGLTGALADMVRSWSERNDYIPLLHDPLALMYALDSSFASTCRIKAAVVESGLAEGITLNLTDGAGCNGASYKRPDARTVTVVNGVDERFVVKKFMSKVFNKSEVSSSAAQCGLETVSA